MDPFTMLNNDMANLLMQAQSIMDEWQDNNAGKFKNECLNSLKSRYNNYIGYMNTCLRTLIIHEQKIMEAYKNLVEL